MRRMLFIVGLVVVFGFAFKLVATSDSPSQMSKQVATSAARFDKTVQSLSSPTSIWVIVNKQRPIAPNTYEPHDLIMPDLPQRVPGNESMQVRQVIYQPLLDMFAAAKAASAPLMVSSGYRSFSFQTTLYNSYVAAHGSTEADTFSARPGYSEHQSGLAIDVEPLDTQCDVDQCFADTSAGKWVAAHASEYGFIIRYPAGKATVTGYEYEPWHLRYVGKELAAEMQKTHTSTLEEFFSLPAALNY